VAKYAKASWPLIPPSPSCQMYKQLSRIERNQIQSLLKANQTIIGIARLLDKHRRTNRRKLDRGRDQRGYRDEQACSKSSERTQSSRNANRQRFGPMWLSFMGFNGAPSRFQPRCRSAMRESICMCMRTKPPVVIYTRTCAATAQTPPVRA
jgi:hypothetical protein